MLGKKRLKDMIVKTSARLDLGESRSNVCTIVFEYPVSLNVVQYVLNLRMFVVESPCVLRYYGWTYSYLRV